ncbi:Zn(II)2Cys6 transcription factor [Aspergillus homomorphus CBS 101889]|uniref:Zn(2)-C6 fungal-type domain-containing protein n=1 Tax=Aspergillus homomorphus (strain CBS 101889) TaxID=1450537 RepID=A0A395HIV9_ASPHC|nr:hypothetical protein BO97DRAFT_243336 [Aspergillus homomorphus CBS 101889]RAL07700.1 hypothetical protein BO97DRAFT_243336 [Aspergillus homomorphus CBS 101889]
MANRNRGSLSCEHCRRRRIKCNQLRPRCSQCARAGLSCSGYRAPLDLLFRDETTTVARKVRKGKEDNSDADYSDLSDIFSQLNPSLASRIHSIEVDVAWNYYLENFNVTRNKRDCFPTLTLTSSSTGVASVTAVGLAGLALLRHDVHMMQLARQKYSMALRHMGHAVLDPQQLRNGTLATASFNLSMFEMIVTDGVDAAPYAWLKHIHGTAALMRAMHMPTKGGLFNTAGCLQIAFAITMGCLISEQPVSPDIVSLVQIYANSSPFIGLFILLSDLVNLYVQEKKAHYGSQSATARALASIDAELTSWESRLPPLWKDSPITRGVPNDQGSTWVPRLWGYYRVCRMLVHRVFLDATHPSPGREQVSHGILKSLCSDIYASVPSILRQCFTDDHPDPGPGLTSDVFFLVTILQALSTLTARNEVVENWATPATEELGEGFVPLKAFVARHLG